MKFPFKNDLRFKVSIFFLVSIFLSFAVHFVIAVRSAYGWSLPAIKVLSDVAFSGLLFALAAYVGLFVWTLFRERKFAFLFVFYFTVTFVLTVFYAFSWSLETEGFRP